MDPDGPQSPFPPSCERCGRPSYGLAVCYECRENAKKLRDQMQQLEFDLQQEAAREPDSATREVYIRLVVALVELRLRTRKVDVNG